MTPDQKRLKNAILPVAGLLIVLVFSIVGGLYWRNKLMERGEPTIGIITDIGNGKNEVGGISI